MPLSFYLHGDALHEYQLGCELLGSLPERLALLRAVNTVQPDTLALAVVQDGDDLVSEERFRTGHYLGSSTRQRN